MDIFLWGKKKLKNHRAYFTTLCVGCLLILSGALQAAPLNTDDIIKLKQLGFSDQEIQQEVSQSGEPVTLGEGGVTELKKAGISEDLIAALAGEDPQAQASAEATKSKKTYFDESGAMPSEEDEFVQPQIPAAPAAPPPAPAPVLAPKLQPTHPTAAPVPTQPAAMVAQTTTHRLQAGQTAAFNLPYNNTSQVSVMVTAMAPGAEWISITPTGAPAGAGGNAEFRVQLSAATLSPGSYQGSVFLSAEGSSIEYPFQLTVLPGARPLSQPVHPMPVPTPAPIPGSNARPMAPPSGYGSPPPSGYGALSPELVGSWYAVLPGEWGVQTILYIELEANGRYTYSELQGNQLIDQSTGTVTARSNFLQVVTDDGERDAYTYQMHGEQLYINMPELGGNVPFYRE